MLPLWFMVWFLTASSANDIDADGAVLARLAHFHRDAVQVTFSKHEVSSCTCTEVPRQQMICIGGPKCHRFPSTINTTSPLFQLKTTAIAVIRTGDFRGLSLVESLEIEDNNRLKTIEPEVFIYMGNLRNLSMSSNGHLHFLEEDTFKGLDNLIYLQLGKNGFGKWSNFIAALSPVNLPRLLKLSLNENPLLEIAASDLLALNGTTLEELHLISCQLEHIHPKSLKPLQNLRALFLGQNPLSVPDLSALIGQLTTDNVPLYLLNLYGIGLQKEIPVQLIRSIANSSITHLVLARNHFHNLSPGSFPFMPKLEFLDLREIVAVNFVPDVLNQTLTPKLKTLLLGGNKLPGLVPGALLPQLTSLDLSTNSGDTRLYSYFQIPEDSFVNMTQLSYLNLSYNNVQTISSTTFRGLTRLDMFLGLKNASIIYIEPGSFRDLGRLKHLSLENNPFPSYMNLTGDVFAGLRSLKTLLFGGCGISSFARDLFIELPRLQYLSLPDNHLLALGPSDFTALTNLKGLDLSNNEIGAWEDRVFRNNTKLKQLFLPDNKLTHLSPSMLQDFLPISQLELFRNPFSCDCLSFSSSRIWLISLNLTLDSLHLVGPPLHCSSPDKWRDKYLGEFLLTIEEEPCEFGTIGSSAEGNKMFIWVCVLTVLLVVVVVTSVMLMYRYRSHIRYWTFLTHLAMRRRGFGKRRQVSEGYSNYQYDAFVSYSSEDRNFVVRLVAMLENYDPYLKLCVYERDFEIGTMISESVLQSVAMSRRTLLIISDAFAKSQWCMWELRLAGNLKLFLDDCDADVGEDSLIMVKLGEVTEANMTPVLRYLLKTRIYLSWDQEPRKQRQFWDKLRAALAPPAVTISPTAQQ